MKIAPLGTVILQNRRRKSAVELVPTFPAVEDELMPGIIVLPSQYMVVLYPYEVIAPREPSIFDGQTQRVQLLAGHEYIDRIIGV